MNVPARPKDILTHDLPICKQCFSFGGQKVQILLQVAQNKFRL